MDDELPPRRERGSRVGVLLVGIVIGAVAMTVFWFWRAGNPLSDDNEIAFETITVADVSAEGDQICWSQEPARRDSEQLCAILALDPAATPPQPGQTVTIGRTQLRPPSGDGTTQVVYVGPASGSDPADTAPAATPG